MLIKSFSEKALLNDIYLKYCYPSNCQETKIENPDPSVINTLKSLEISNFDKPLKTNLSHRALKPLRVVARIVYFIAVGCLIAPLGVAWNSALACKHLVQYRIANTQEAKNEEWKKVAAFAKAALTDLSVAAFGALNAAFAVGGVVYLGLAITSISAMQVGTALGSLFTAAFAAGGTSFLTGAVSPDWLMPQILSWDKERAGLYIALKLRNDLGLVNKNGGLLPYSEDDEIVTQAAGYRHFRFTGQGDEELVDFIYETELDMVRLMGETSQRLQQKGRDGIPYAFPFNAKTIQQHIGQGDVELSLFSEKIMRYSRTIDLLRGIHKTAREMAVNGSLLEQILSKEQTFIWNGQPVSYVRANFYRRYFEQCQLPDQPAAPVATTLQETQAEIANLDLDALDPTTYVQAEDASLYDRFKDQLRIAKWKMQNGQAIEMHKLLGLQDGYSEVERKRAIRAHQIALHPDKNQNSDEATTLFKCFEKINKVLT